MTHHPIYFNVSHTSSPTSLESNDGKSMDCANILNVIITIWYASIYISLWFSVSGSHPWTISVYSLKCAHCYLLLRLLWLYHRFLLDCHDIFAHILQGCFPGTGAINASDVTLKDMENRLVFNHNKTQKNTNPVYMSRAVLYWMWDGIIAR